MSFFYNRESKRAYIVSTDCRDFSANLNKRNRYQQSFSTICVWRIDIYLLYVTRAQIDGKKTFLVTKKFKGSEPPAGDEEVLFSN